VGSNVNVGSWGDRDISVCLSIDIYVKQMGFS